MMRDQLLTYLSNYNGGYKHKNAIRYLYTREPELWNNILEKTLFLPNAVPPKQRCWHILNNMYKRPLCPVTGEHVKWYKCAYAQTASYRASGKNPARMQKINNTMLRRYGTKHALRVDKFKEKAKKTLIASHGVENPSHSPEILSKIKHSMIDSGRWKDPLLFPDSITFKHYRYMVDNVTTASYKLFKDIINPEGVKRSALGYHLDHIYSAVDGYVNGVPPEVIGHWTNLQIMHYKTNIQKHGSSDKTLNALYEDYELELIA